MQVMKPHETLVNSDIIETEVRNTAPPTAFSVNKMTLASTHSTSTTNYSNTPATIENHNPRHRGFIVQG